jgi:hypothetical protein
LRGHHLLGVPGGAQVGKQLAELLPDDRIGLLAHGVDLPIRLHPDGLGPDLVVALARDEPAVRLVCRSGVALGQPATGLIEELLQGRRRHRVLAFRLGFRDRHAVSP